MHVKHSINFFFGFQLPGLTVPTRFLMEEFRADTYNNKMVNTPLFGRCSIHPTAFCDLRLTLTLTATKRITAKIAR